MVSFPQVSPPEPCAPLPSPIRTTCPAHLILLDFTARTILSEATTYVLNVRSHLPSDTVSHLRRIECWKLVVLNVHFRQKLKFKLLSKVQNILQLFAQVWYPICLICVMTAVVKGQSCRNLRELLLSCDLQVPRMIGGRRTM